MEMRLKKTCVRLAFLAGVAVVFVAPATRVDVDRCEKITIMPQLFAKNLFLFQVIVLDSQKNLDCEI